MGLITCPECRREVSEYAELCPQCGFPIKKIDSNNQQIKNNIPSRIDDIFQMRIMIGEEIIDIIKTNQEIESYNISYYLNEAKLNSWRELISKYNRICDKLECLANDTERLSHNDRYSNCFTYLRDNLDEYKKIISHGKEIHRYESLISRIKGISEELNPYDDNIKNELISEDIKILYSLESFNLKFAITLQRIVDKVNQIIFS